MSADAGRLGTAPLTWKEACHANCPVVFASNADEATGRAREEPRKTGVQRHWQGLFEFPIAE